mgnify:FL=1
MYLFKPSDRKNHEVTHLNLHSTMYLFKPVQHQDNPYRHVYLHSTMYLFQQGCNLTTLLVVEIYIPLCIYFNVLLATLQAVALLHLHSTMYLFQPTIHKYIKKHHINLHSTMYLFQPSATGDYGASSATFTFHYVSI